MEHYMIFTELMLTFSYMRQYFRSLPMELVLSTQCFTSKLFQRSKDTLVKCTNNITYNYFNKQLQSPITNVCGEYVLLFLYIMCRQKYPERCAYSFWNNRARFTQIAPSYKLTRLQNRQLLRTDLYVCNTVASIFKYYDNNVFAE